MNTSQVNISQLLADLDALRIEALPLATHSLVRFDTHIREAYATQLATLLLVENTPSEAQSRLFSQLLQSLELGQEASPRLLQLAQQTNQESLREFVKLAQEHRLEASFIVDGLVLCRLAGPLNENLSQIFSEYVQLMQVQEADLALYAHLASRVLGLANDYELATNFNFEGYKVEVWQEFFYRELTQAMLDENADLNNGLWLIKRELIIKSNLAIEKSSLKWEGEKAKFTQTSSGDYRLSFEGCLIENPIIDVCRETYLNFNGCKITGVYPLQNKITVFNVDDGGVGFNDCYIETKNARLIEKKSGYNLISIVNSKVVNCGHPDLSGGVILIADTSISRVSIEDSSFISCIAKQGAVICAKTIYGLIEDSIFNNCFSQGFDIEKAKQNPINYLNSGGAILTNAFGGSAFGNSAHKLFIVGNSFVYSNISFYSFYNTTWKGNKIKNSFVINPGSGNDFDSMKESFEIEGNDFGQDLIVTGNINIDWDKISKEG